MIAFFLIWGAFFDLGRSLTEIVSFFPSHMARTPGATGYAPPPQPPPPPPPPRAGRGRGAGGGKRRISAASAASSAASDDDEVDGGGASAKKKRAGGLAAVWDACELGTLVSIMKVWCGLLFFHAC